MTICARWRRVAAAVLASGMTLTGPAFAAGWAMHELETPSGEAGAALRVAAKRRPGVHLAIACDAGGGSSWRGVAVVEDPDSGAALGMRGDVVIRLGDRTSREVWAVRTTTDERRVFTAPDATRFARKLLRAEADAPAAEVTVDIHGVAGKPVPLTFPLAGLGAKIDQIAAKCRDWDIREKE
jgi:hypothetical protein